MLQYDSRESFRADAWQTATLNNTSILLRADNRVLAWGAYFDTAESRAPRLLDDRWLTGGPYPTSDPGFQTPAAGDHLNFGTGQDHDVSVSP